MTDLILQSNQISTILKGLSSAEVQDLSYEIPPSFPLLAKRFQEIQANGGSVSGVMNNQEVVFNINRSMLVRDMLIKTTFTTTTTNMTTTQYPGMTMFDTIQLRTNNKVIMTMTDAY